MPTLQTPVSPRDFFQGALDAPVQIVHFGDFECPYSAALWQTLKQLQAEEGERLLLVFRPFPLTDIHPNALIATRAAFAANEQNHFWPMADALFKNHDALDEAFLKRYAQEINLDAARFESDIRSSQFDPQIEASIKDAKDSGAHGTPTLYINDKFHDNREGLWKIQRLREALKSANS